MTELLDRAIAAREKAFAPYSRFLVVLLLCWMVIGGPACLTETKNSIRSSVEQVDLLVTEGYVVTMDHGFTEYPDGFVAVRGGRIVALGPMTEAGHYRGTKTIDAERGLVLPGLVNGHGHAAMTLMRGLGEELELMGWLENYVFPIESELVSGEYVYWGTMLGCCSDGKSSLHKDKCPGSLCSNVQIY